MKFFLYPVIDMHRTGKWIQKICRLYGKNARILQQELGLTSVQSVYDWFHGRTLPSLDNMCALSQLLGLNIEDLLIGKLGFPFAWQQKLEKDEKRLLYYAMMLAKNTAEYSSANTISEVHEENIYICFPLASWHICHMIF